MLAQVQQRLARSTFSNTSCNRRMELREGTRRIGWNSSQSTMFCLRLWVLRKSLLPWKAFLHFKVANWILLKFYTSVSAIRPHGLRFMVFSLTISTAQPLRTIKRSTSWISWTIKRKSTQSRRAKKKAKSRVERDARILKWLFEIRLTEGKSKKGKIKWKAKGQRTGAQHISEAPQDQPTHYVTWSTQTISGILPHHSSTTTTTFLLSSSPWPCESQTQEGSREHHLDGGVCGQSNDWFRCPSSNQVQLHEFHSVKKEQFFATARITTMRQVWHSMGSSNRLFWSGRTQTMQSLILKQQADHCGDRLRGQLPCSSPSVCVSVCGFQGWFLEVLERYVYVCPQVWMSPHQAPSLTPLQLEGNAFWRSRVWPGVRMDGYIPARARRWPCSTFHGKTRSEDMAKKGQKTQVSKWQIIEIAFFCINSALMEPKFPFCLKQRSSNVNVYVNNKRISSSTCEHCELLRGVVLTAFGINVSSMSRSQASTSYSSAKAELCVVIQTIVESLPIKHFT